MIASSSKLDAKVTAIVLLALSGFLLSLVLLVLRFPAVAEELGAGVRVWRGASQEPAFGEVAEEAREAAEAEASEPPPAPARATPRAKKRRRDGIRVHGAQGRAGPALYRTHRAGQWSRGVPTYRTRHRAGGYPTGGYIKTHRAGTWQGGRIVTHRAGKGETGKIRTHRAGSRMRTTRVE